MEGYEKLGVFCPGSPCQPGEGRPGQGLILYDSKDLVTHAVCVGMTGSGKSGLCVSFVEERLGFIGSSGDQISKLPQSAEFVI